MAELVLHDLDSMLMQRLADLASRSGRTIEQEAKLVLERSVGLAKRQAAEAALRIRKSHGHTFGDSVDLICEDRDRSREN